MPLTFGGRIRTTEDIRARLQAGADKVTLNTIALEDISFIEKSAKQFGSQCIVISVDAKRHGNTWKVYKGGIEETALQPMEWAKSVENAGAGEILLNSIDMDGSGKGYDIELLMEISENVRLPVIALGGVGKWEHFAEALMRSKISAVAAANIFHYSENSVFEAKKYLFQAGFNVRKPSALSKVSRNL
jgi:imidazole glycerol-phosphate synthase subunit HisF